MPRSRAQPFASDNNGSLHVDPRARHAGSSVALVTRTLRSEQTEEQYRNKQGHWKVWCAEQRFLTGCVPRENIHGPLTDVHLLVKP